MRRLPRSLKTSELIAREIVREISEAKLQPGAALPHENTMVARYQAGRASVREALRLLEAQGLIYLKPGRNGGPVLARTGPQQLGQMLTLYLRMSGATYGDLAEFMRTVSPRLAELAAQNPNRELVMKTMGKTDSNPCALVDADPAEDGPHALVNHLAGNPVLTMFADAVDAVFSSHATAATGGGRDFAEQASAEHKAIAEAVIAGKGRKARELMAEHIDHIVEWVGARVPGLLDKTIEWK